MKQELKGHRVVINGGVHDEGRRVSSMVPGRRSGWPVAVSHVVAAPPGSSLRPLELLLLHHRWIHHAPPYVTCPMYVPATFSLSRLFFMDGGNIHMKYRKPLAESPPQTVSALSTFCHVPHPSVHTLPAINSSTNLPN